MKTKVIDPHTQIEILHPALVNAAKFLSIVYLMTLTVFGVTLPFGYLLQGGVGKADGVYLWLYHIYLSVVGIAFLLYIYIKLHRLRPVMKYKDEAGTPHDSSLDLSRDLQEICQNSNEVADFIVPDVDSNVTKHYDKPQTFSNGVEKDPEKQKEQIELREIYKDLVEQHKHTKVSTIATARQQPPVMHGGHGINLFLRLGAIGFAMGSMLLDALRITEYYQTPDARKCYGSLFLAQCYLRLIFVFMQTHLIFKHHQIIINFNHSIIWWGGLHLISTNIVLWFSGVIVEAYREFYSSDIEDLVTENPGNLTTNGLNCVANGFSLFTTLREYLYPQVIEYSLIAAAVLYQIVSNTGAIVNPIYQQFLQEQAASSQVGYNMECHKASKGMFIGLLIFVTTFAVVLAFMINTEEHVTDAYLYLGINVALQVISLLSCLAAMYKLRVLVTTTNIDYPVDEYPLICCLAGLYFLLGAQIAAASAGLGNGKDWDNFCILFIVGSIFGFLQATVQTMFIIHASRREAATLRQQHEKPGRPYISILILCNLSTWLINSFQLKESFHSQILISFFGQLAWTILLYIVMPLAVFYRFQSVVSLTHIWIEVYKKRWHAVIRIHPDQIATHFLHEEQKSEDTGAGKREIGTSHDKPDIDLEKSESNGLENTKRETKSLHNKLDRDIESNSNSAVEKTQSGETESLHNKLDSDIGSNNNSAVVETKF